MVPTQSTFALILEAGRQAAGRAGRSWFAALSEPCTDEQIQNAERAVGVAFPRSYRAFLMYSNGARIGTWRDGSEGGDLRLMIYGVDTVVRQSPDRAVEWRGGAARPIFFANFEGDADPFTFDTLQPSAAGEYAILFASHDDPTSWSDGVPIAASFDDWFRDTVNKVAINEYDERE